MSNQTKPFNMALTGPSTLTITAHRANKGD